MNQTLEAELRGLARMWRDMADQSAEVEMRASSVGNALVETQNNAEKRAYLKLASQLEAALERGREG